MKQLIIFDLDGTLNQTELYSVEVHRMVQTEFGWPALSPEAIIATFGAPASEYMSTLLPGSDEETQLAYKRRVAEVEHDYMHLARSYPGCQELMNQLHQRGYLTAVCSNSSHRYISMVLTAIGLMDKIDYIQPLETDCKDKAESLKRLLEKVNPQRAAMVGDTMYDCQAARSNHIPFIGCRYGFRPSEMEAVNITVSQPLEVVYLLDDLFSKPQ